MYVYTKAYCNIVYTSHTDNIIMIIIILYYTDWHTTSCKPTFNKYITRLAKYKNNVLKNDNFTKYTKFTKYYGRLIILSTFVYYMYFENLNILL